MTEDDAYNFAEREAAEHGRAYVWKWESEDQWEVWTVAPRRLPYVVVHPDGSRTTVASAKREETDT